MIKELAASRRMDGPEPAANCSEVNTIAIELTTLVIRSPACPQIVVFSDTIIASRNVVCTEAEKVDLAEVDPLFKEAVVVLVTEIETARGKHIFSIKWWHRHSPLLSTSWCFCSDMRF